MDSSINTDLTVNDIRAKPLFQKTIKDTGLNNIHHQKKNDILMILIYIYYYEKNELNIKKGISFKEKEKYYLIKSTWIRELKNYFDYQKISKILDEFKLTKDGINIPSLNELENNNILERIKLYLNNSDKNILNKKPNTNLIDSEIKMLPFKLKNNFIYYSNGYIINSKILEIIKNYMLEGQAIKIKPINIFNKENNIIISWIKNNAFVTFGNLNNELIFIANSCLVYYNLNIFNNEKKFLLNLSFKNYITSRKCQENNLNVQTLTKEIDEKLYKIGLFLKIKNQNVQRNYLLQKTLIKNMQNELKKKVQIINKYKKENSKNKLIIEQLKEEQTNLIEENKNLKGKIGDLENEVLTLKNILSYKANLDNEIEQFNVMGGEKLYERKSQEFINDRNQNEKLIIENINLINQIGELKKQLNQSKNNINEGKKVLLKSDYQSDEIISFIDDKKLNQKTENSNEGKKPLLRSDYQSDEIINFIDKSKQSQYESQIQNLNSDNQQTIPISLIPKENPLQTYIEPTLIGLNNIRAKSYINPILQCLNQIPSLINYFLNGSNQEMILNNNTIKESQNLLKLSPSYLQLTRMLWDKNKKGSSFSPYDFIENIEKMNPSFKNEQKSDSKDFIIFILEQIHLELKRQNNFQKYSIPLNQYDRKNAFINFMNDFLKECSIISDTFFGIIETTNICLYCKNFYSSKGINYPICYNYGIFNCLIFSLEEVRNFRNNLWANDNNQINQNNITINDCFLYNQKTERLIGENKNYCNICKQLYDSEYTSRIYRSPRVLILILNSNNNIKLDFTETLDLTQFVVEKDSSQMVYNLRGVISHLELIGSNEHYIGFCKSPINNQWYSYNDAFVNLVEDVQKEIINFGTPNILFYQKSN